MGRKFTHLRPAAQGETLQVIQPAVRYTYDQVPYPSLSHASTHPNHLATLARLLGMQPAAVEHCRVLELGCGPGGNLIPMACALPHSEFLGVDLAAVQVEDGCQNIKRLGLANIQLRQMDILDVSADLGQFDYILAHGVYSWVPAAVREKILDIVAQNLAPHGVAFVSYNTFPGWHMINLARGIMRYYTRDIPDPLQKVSKARSILEWFSQAGETDSHGYFGYLKMYADYLAGKTDDDNPKDDAALLHDELEDINQPFYFHEFMEHVTRHRLQYLGDADHISGGKLLAQNLETLRSEHHSLLDIEQSYDFLRNRTFRKSLLCHQDVVLDRKVTPARIAGFYVASSAQPETEMPDICGSTVEKFKILNGVTFSTDHPLSKAAMLCLADIWPRPILFETLFEQARIRLDSLRGQNQSPAPPVSDEDRNRTREMTILGANLLKAYNYDPALVELHSSALSLCSWPVEHPRAAPWCALQAQEHDWVTNLRHERVELDEIDRFLLVQLDGNRDVPALVDLFQKGPVAEGRLTLESDGKPATGEELSDLLTQEISSRLAWLSKAALLIDLTFSGEDENGKSDPP